MKRLNTSDDFFSKEEKRSKKAQIYSREFQAMLDGLDRDECGGGEAEEELCGGGGAAGDKKRRLSSEQVKALEKNFEVENKLEPERKSQLAEELGLQPRQVAIWFQNRRARFKTKQLERDYGILKADYDSLKLEFDHLEQENEALLAELRQLKIKLNQENADSNMVLCYGAAAAAKEGEGEGEDQSPASESVTNAGGVAINGIHNIHGVDPIYKEDPTQYEDEDEEDKLLSFQHHNSSSSPLLNWPIHFSNNNINNLSSSREAAADEIGNTEESCNNFFSVVDHAPTLHRYFPQ